MPGVATETNPLVDFRSPLSVWMVSAPFDAIDVVPVAPNATVFADKFVVDAPPENVRRVVVALPTNGYPIEFVMTPVEELYVMPDPAESEVLPNLLLKVFQSAEVSLPVFAPDAAGRLKVMVEPEPVMVKSEPTVEVANVTAPLETCWPAGPTAVIEPAFCEMHAPLTE